VNPGAGVGVQLLDFDDELKQRLTAFVEAASSEAPGSADGSNPDAGRANSDFGLELDPVADSTDAESDAEQVQAHFRNIYDRIRAMSAIDRETMARNGTLTQRVALERCFKSAVWEGLLHNPQLTPPEVMRIAKNGTLSKSLLNLIVNNAAWVSKPEVQRALLSNPRVSGSVLDRVLRAMGRADLQRVAQNLAYRTPVRTAAKRLLSH
jgi:hypothetical protein